MIEQANVVSDSLNTSKKKKKKKKKKTSEENEIIDFGSSTKKLKSMKAIIDDNLSPIKQESDDNSDFRFKV